MATKLILIRHGQTEWNSQKRYSGFIDIGLSCEGKKQAGELCKKLKNERIHKVYSSGKVRAIETAKIIFKGLDIEVTPQLREMHFGIFEGLTYKQVMARYPAIYKKWLNNPFSVTIPEGEDLKEFREGVLNTFKKIISCNRDKTVAIISHGGTISIFINGILKSKNFWKQIPDSASLSIVEYKNGRANIRLFNDTSHLLYE